MKKRRISEKVNSFSITKVLSFVFQISRRMRDGKYYFLVRIASAPYPALATRCYTSVPQKQPAILEVRD